MSGIDVFVDSKAYGDQTCDERDDRADKWEPNALRVDKLIIGSKDDIASKEKHDEGRTYGGKTLEFIVPEMKMLVRWSSKIPQSNPYDCRHKSVTDAVKSIRSEGDTLRNRSSKDYLEYAEGNKYNSCCCRDCFGDMNPWVLVGRHRTRKRTVFYMNFYNVNIKDIYLYIFKGDVFPRRKAR